jgi:hypothetical protein
MPRLKNEDDRKHFPKYTLDPNDPKPPSSKTNRELKLAYNKWYYRNFRKDKESVKNKQLTGKTLRTKNKAFVKEYLLCHPCVDCGEADIIVLEFDHRNREDKKYCIGRTTNFSLNTLKREIEKCDVRCANCHRRKTFKDLGWSKD